MVHEVHQRAGQRLVQPGELVAVQDVPQEGTDPPALPNQVHVAERCKNIITALNAAGLGPRLPSLVDAS